MPDPEQQRHKPLDRERLGADLKRGYSSGETIRELAERTGYSYGFVRKLLLERNVTLRGRGGANRTRKART